MDPERLATMRREYARAGLVEQDLPEDPYALFADWLHDASEVDLPEPNAVIVSTVSAEGQPSSRAVLLKGYDTVRGFLFFTNYGSRKAREIAGNPRVSLLFPWHALGRQVIVLGTATRASADESARYFRSRPHESQLGAWASRQSQPVASRDELDRHHDELSRRWPEGTDVPVPDFWGGFWVKPESIEFWQGRAGRMHDRLRYREIYDGWRIERLSP